MILFKDIYTVVNPYKLLKTVHLSVDLASDLHSKCEVSVTVHFLAKYSTIVVH